MYKRWHLVYTKPKREVEAETHFQNQSYTVYLPRHRVGARRRGRYTEVIEPLFPRYLFIQLTEGVDNLAPIRSTRGAVGLVRQGLAPSIAPPELIDYLRRNEAKEHSLDSVNPFHQGDKVRVVDGPFAGYDAIYQCDKGEERALILLDLMNKFSEVTLSIHNLAVDAA